MKMFYKSGYKYQLEYTYKQTLPDCFKPFSIRLRYFTLIKGELTLHPGYAWDGASGPTWDTPSCIAGSAVHDALYQLMRKSLIPRALRDDADDVMYQTFLRDGMYKIRAWVWCQSVKRFGAKHTHENASRPILAAGFHGNA